MIIHSPDKERAAKRLGDAIAAEGYALTAVEVAEPDRLADAVESCDANAKILIWSKALVFHSLHSGELPRIRQIRGLIEVSADGIAPPSRGDEARTVLISGWRGQPFHPGWQRIHLELKRLCGTGKGAGAAPRLAATPANVRPRTAAPPAADGPARAPAHLMLGGAVALLLLGAGVGAATWLGGKSPDARPDKAVGIREAPPIREASPPVPAATPAAKTAGGTGPAPDLPASQPAQAETSAEDKQERPKARPASPSVQPKASKATSQRAPSRADPAKKYSARNSKVMRQFCERSGRSTPQCRTFLRSTRSP